MAVDDDLGPVGDAEPLAERRPRRSVEQLLDGEVERARDVALPRVARRSRRVPSYSSGRRTSTHGTSPRRGESSVELDLGHSAGHQLELGCDRGPLRERVEPALERAAAAQRRSGRGRGSPTARRRCRRRG